MRNSFIILLINVVIHYFFQELSHLCLIKFIVHFNLILEKVTVITDMQCKSKRKFYKRFFCGNIDTTF